MSTIGRKVAGTLALGALFLVGCEPGPTVPELDGGTEPAAALTAVSLDGRSNVDVLVASLIQLQAGTALTVPASQQLTGNWTWFFSMLNHDPSFTYADPTISINSSRSGVVGIVTWDDGTVEGDMIDPVPIEFPVTVTQETLPPHGRLRHDFTWTSIAETLHPGYHSSRSVEPAVIPTGESQQTLTVSMSLVDGSRYTEPRNITLNAGGVKCDDILMPALDDGEETSFIVCDEHGVGIGLGDVVLGKEYTFTLLLTVTNPFAEPAEFAPGLSIKSDVGASLGFHQGTEAGIFDPVLDGMVMFEVAEEAPWNRGAVRSFAVHYDPIAEPASPSPPPPSPPVGLICENAVPSQGLLWPPDHRLVAITVAGVTNAAGNEVPAPIAVTSIFQDEPVNARGDGNHEPDGHIDGSTAWVRAERSALGNGRVYHIDFTAGLGDGACAGTVQVGVPLDMGRNRVPVDDGPLYDSTAAP